MNSQETTKRAKQARFLRITRKIHRFTGVWLFALFSIMAITGLLLGWKKHSGGAILAKTYSGTSIDPQHRLPLDSLQTIAVKLLHDSISSELSTELDRIDIRPDKGMAKFLFKDHFQSLQIDLATGKLLHVETRRADIIEKIHDGSLIDRSFGISNEFFKLFYTSLMGLSLLIFTVTGFWLWYGPKNMRK